MTTTMTPMASRATTACLTAETNVKVARTANVKLDETGRPVAIDQDRGVEAPRAAVLHDQLREAQLEADARLGRATGTGGDGCRRHR